MARYVVLVFALPGDSAETDPSDDALDEFVTMVEAPPGWAVETVEIVADADAMRYVLPASAWTS